MFSFHERNLELLLQVSDIKKYVKNQNWYPLFEPCCLYWSSWVMISCFKRPLDFRWLQWYIKIYLMVSVVESLICSFFLGHFYIYIYIYIYIYLVKYFCRDHFDLYSKISNGHGNSINTFNFRSEIGFQNCDCALFLIFCYVN